MAKNVILGFQSSALPTELPSLPELHIQSRTRPNGKW